MTLAKIVAVLVMASACLPLCAVGKASVTKGVKCEAPSFDLMPYTVSGELSAIQIPNDGWKIDWPSDEYKPETNSVPGIKIVSTNVIIRGAVKPAIVLELTRGTFSGNCHPVVSLDFPVNFDEYNVWSFAAKIEVPEGCGPLIHGSRSMTGWSGATISRYFDNFGISAYDGVVFPWVSCGVFATDFKNHHYPATRTHDGFLEFRWDVPHEERSGFKGFVHDRAKKLQYYYDTRKIPEGKTVRITIADMKLVKGAHLKFDEPEMYAEWLDYVKNYKPDYSDSSEYLNPPKTGRVGLLDRVQLVKDGKALGEIVVDVSPSVYLDNYFPSNRWIYEVKQTRGFEISQMRNAAYEMQRWLKVITGADFPVLSKPSDKKNAKIFLGPGYAKDLPTFKEDIEFLAQDDKPHSTSPAFRGGIDGFAVRVKDGNVYIYGAHPMGTANGVHAFFENNTDIIWAVAGDENGTIFTPTKDLTVVWGDAIEKPHFILRGWQGGNRDWQKCNRSNYYLDRNEYGFNRSGGHYLSPMYYDKAEGLQRFSAVVDGKRVIPWSEYEALCCLADPEFIKHSSETVPTVGEIVYSGNNTCVFGVDDNYGVCECPLCTKPIKTLDGRTITPKNNYEEYYGAWFYDYINRLDDMIQKVRPGFMTSTYAYFFARNKPPIKVNKTITPLLCTYYRKGYNIPVFAPANQGWWKTYKDWIAHSKELFMYDYYGLGFVGQPLAEVFKFDLIAQRKIGYLKNSTEGFGSTEYIGVADERWCINRLEWNTDYDPEQLHRYFNRRTYREAAPYMDKFRGIIRENWFKRNRAVNHLHDSREIACMVKEFGLEHELRDCLNKAMDAVKNPKSRVLLQKFIADWDYFMHCDKWQRRWPSRGMATPVVKQEPTLPWACDVALQESVKEIKGYIAAGDFCAATNTIVTAFSDNLACYKNRESDLGNVMRDLVARFKQANAATVADILRKVIRDEYARAWGISLYMQNYGGKRIMNSVSEGYTKRGDFVEMSRLYDIWADWDGDALPISMRTACKNAFMDRIRSIRKKAELDRNEAEAKCKARPNDTAWLRRYSEAIARYANALEVEKAYYSGWRQINEKCLKSAARAGQRGGAFLRLYREDESRMTRDARLQKLFTIINDKFMPSNLRRTAAEMIIDACTENGKVDWKAAVENYVKALKAGDWSGLWRSAYARQNRTDKQLDSLIDVVNKINNAGEKAIAADLLVKGATVLGYTKDATKKSVDKGGPAGFENRIKKLDDTMKKFGVSRK